MKRISYTFSKECILYHKETVREYLENSHVFEYSETTVIADLFRYIIDQSGFTLYDSIEEVLEDNEAVNITDAELLRFFMILHNNEHYSLWNPYVSVDKLFTYLGISDSVELHFENSFGGEGNFNDVECEGIQFYFHSDERKHWGKPHVHAIRDKKWITIDLEQLTVLKGHFKKKRYETEALECVKAHIDTFIKGWNDHSNGIKVNLPDFYNQEPA